MDIHTVFHFEQDKKRDNREQRYDSPWVLIPIVFMEATKNEQERMLKSKKANRSAQTAKSSHG
ncbi:hypothetical protein E2C01_044965 [Portunus trituberculatus]|uniref:Uncharacterized protein n=1 Tax=Portunus trituberculatus TaxID=210409 RepID=A0A5B7G0S0_PORTR|nr:hypothetical protein [Portunus trituberculatus]